MRAVLFFCGWLILCYTSIAAKENNFTSSDTTHTFIQASKSAFKKKKLLESKIKPQTPKGRLLPAVSFNLKNSISNIDYCTTKAFEPNLPLKLFTNQIYKRYIFNHIYAKHAFW